MSVYVDPIFTWPISATKGAQAKTVAKRNNGQWCHLIGDTEEELHKFAKLIGMRRIWYQDYHYDLTPGRRKEAVKQGAIELDRHTFTDKYRALKKEAV
jgi:hypothetical protein